MQGKRAYVEFLSRVVPALQNYELRVSRIHKLGETSAVVKLSETLDLEGVPTEFPEALFFDFDGDGRILKVKIYIQRPPIDQSPGT